MRHELDRLGRPDAHDQGDRLAVVALADDLGARARRKREAADRDLTPSVAEIERLGSLVGRGLGLLLPAQEPAQEAHQSRTQDAPRAPG